MNIQSMSEIHGVNFFNNRSSCISQYEKFSWTKKAISLIKSFGTMLPFAFNKLSLAFNKVEAQMDHFANPKSLSKTKLVVCIHGLNSNPSQFKKIVDELRKDELEDTDFFIPCVLEKGNAKLDDMVQPIFEKIEKWGESHGEKELTLVGISNGGRIARAIETRIAKSKNCSNIKKIHFISIVGACKGSALVNLANKVGLSRLMSKNISLEMPENSMRNKRMNQEWVDGLTNRLAREYTFVASPHDWQVTNYSSTLMNVRDEKARYAIVPGHGHCSIVNTVAKTVAEIIRS